MSHVLVTGGAGYVGAVLVPKLLKAGHRVTVLDLYLFGDEVLSAVKGNPGLTEIKGDLRDAGTVRKALAGVDAVIHLACISNDPSFELNPTLGKTINFDAFEPLVVESKKAGVRRFIYASSSSVYGISESPNVNEDHPLDPLTDYSRFKAMCEPILLSHASAGFVPVVIRPATVCGYSPRLRLDLTVNILTANGYHHRLIKVFGGSQKRPNLHIEDMTDLYLMLLALPDERVAGKIYNAGYENHTVAELARMVQEGLTRLLPDHPTVAIETSPTDDLRSYHISSDKIRAELGFMPRHTIENAVEGLIRAFEAGRVPEAMTADRYFNIKTMKKVVLQ